MLIPLVPQESGNDNIIRIEEAEVGKTFPWGLEYNCPVHEHWNIVHTGMLIPECHQIYVCPDNCLRGVVMTADEMGAADRISSVMPDEKEILSGDLEKVTIEGVIDVIRKMKMRPRAVQLFPVCTHHFLGCDMRYINSEIRKAYPDIDFMECFMDPVMQKQTTTPEQRQRFQMMKVLADHPHSEDKSSVSMLGENLRVKESDIPELLKEEGVRFLEVQDCETYDNYLAMGASFLWLTKSPLSKYGLERAGKLAGRRTLYLPDAVGYDEIDAQNRMLLVEVYRSRGMEEPEAEEKAKAQAGAWHDAQMVLTEEAFEETRAAAGCMSIWIDYIVCPRPLGWARTLLEHGLDVRRVLVDSISPEESDDLAFLKEKYPSLEVMSTSRPSSLYERERQTSGENILAVGPKAAYFAGTDHFVNVIEQDGSSGYRGIRYMLKRMQRAVREMLTPEIVTGKGLGLPGVWTEEST